MKVRTNARKKREKTDAQKQKRKERHGEAAARSTEKKRCGHEKK